MGDRINIQPHVFKVYGWIDLKYVYASEAITIKVINVFINLKFPCALL